MKMLFVLLPFICISQKEAASWHFGNYAGLNFQNGAPIIIHNSNLQCLSSSSSIADSAGNLLFYVRGANIVYNKNNDTMANGLNIAGSANANGGLIQSSLVIRKSGSQYYIITQNNMNYFFTSPIAPMITYAIADINLSAGLGSITVTNQSISPIGVPMAGRIAATKHCNQKDHWLLAHSGGFPGTNLYYAYLVSSTGISANPVISAIGSSQPQGYIPAHQAYFGLHKFSPNGKKVCATFPYRTVELYDFNSGTGMLSNVIKLDTCTNPPLNYYGYNPEAVGIEFSPDGTKLYISYIKGHPSLCQYNLCAGSPAAIAASKTNIVLDTISGYVPGTPFGLQLGIDGKLYVVNSNSVSLGVIQNPNALGLACNYISNAQPVSPITNYPYFATVGSTLPDFISSFFEQKLLIPPLSGTMVCGTGAFTAPVLCAATGYSIAAYQWNFNDALTGVSNTSSLSNTSHSFSANGIYSVSLILHYASCGADTLKKIINVSGLPNLSVSGSSAICKGENVMINFAGASAYILNGSAVSQNTIIVQPTVTTVYTLTGIDAVSGCQSLKTFTVRVLPCTGITRLTNDDDLLKIFPNPNHGNFRIESTLQLLNIKIYNQIGILVYENFSKSNNQSLDLTRLDNGIYFIEVQNDVFRKIQKLIKN